MSEEVKNYETMRIPADQAEAVIKFLERLESEPIEEAIEAAAAESVEKPVKQAIMGKRLVHKLSSSDTLGQKLYALGYPWRKYR